MQPRILGGKYLIAAPIGVAVPYGVRERSGYSDEA